MTPEPIITAEDLDINRDPLAAAAPPPPMNRRMRRAFASIMRKVKKPGRRRS